ncbi:lysozyme inhibitor LprI family protein [Allorhizobium sp. NPDC080224]|uniref:lysozyme inhibitor LprI family protein n=1 Tax=Allorhizobium sp. NPDC080224 TaxID=3390547 RepID=UPI003D035DB3
MVTKNDVIAVVFPMSLEKCEDHMHDHGFIAHMTSRHGPMLFLVSLSLMAYAPDARSADGSEYEACMESSGGVTADMLACTLTANDEVEAEIELAVKQVISDLDEEKQTALDAAQADWTRFRKSTCEYEAALAGDGSFTSVALADCWLRLSQERLTWLRANDAKDQ